MWGWLAGGGRARRRCVESADHPAGCGRESAWPGRPSSAELGSTPNARGEIRKGQHRRQGKLGATRLSGRCNPGPARPETERRRSPSPPRLARLTGLSPAREPSCAAAAHTAPRERAAPPSTELSASAAGPAQDLKTGPSQATGKAGGAQPATLHDPPSSHPQGPHGLRLRRRREPRRPHLGHGVERRHGEAVGVSRPGQAGQARRNSQRPCHGGTRKVRHCRPLPR